MKNKKIIISGPPSSGKTTIILELNKIGYECISEINPSNNKNIKIQKNKILISNFIFNERKKQYKNAKNTTTFFDRSMIDVIAYLKYWDKNYPKEWDEDIIKYRYYKKIFYAPFWKKIYLNNNYRPESYLESQMIDHELKNTYTKFNYNIIELPKSNIHDRINFILKNI